MSYARINPSGCGTHKNRGKPSLNDMKLNGLVRGSDRDRLIKLATGVKDGVILEVGSLTGASTCAMAEVSKVPVYAIDLWNLTSKDEFRSDPLNNPCFNIDTFKENVKERGLEDKITPIRGESAMISKVWTQPIGLLFIDARHTYEGVTSDYKSFAKHVILGGKIAFHDYDKTHPGVMKAVDEIRESNEWTNWESPAEGKDPVYSSLICGTKIDPLTQWLSAKGRVHYKQLFQTLNSMPCRNIMEIGVFDGTSAVPMIKEAAKLVPEEEIHFFGFDLFEDMTRQVRDEEFSSGGRLPPKMKDVEKMLLGATKAKVSLVKGNTRQTLKHHMKTLPKMDLIFVDGGHTIETTRNDWQYVSELMHKDTVVYFDDYCDEMPFIGSFFIKGELAKNYQSEVMPETDYYQKKFGRFKAQLLKVEKKGLVVKQVTETKPATDHFRFHLLGLPHAITRKEETLCAYTQLVFRLSKMLTGLGHEVYHYGTEGSKLSCTEHIDVLTQAEQRQSFIDKGFPGWTSKEQLWVHNGNDLAYRIFRKNAIKQIRERAEPRDMILISNGSWLAEVGNAFPSMQVIEPMVGYIGFFSKFKVFPSYGWMHHMMGRLSGARNVSDKIKKENFASGKWYDAVIPHFFDPDDSTFSDKKDDYYLFLGRLIKRKGPHIAADMTKRLGAKLVVAGQPIWPKGHPKHEQCLKDISLIQPHIGYVGTVGMDERNKLLTNARALIVPSLYFEPFGLTVIEALLCGTPVITTDWGSFPEIVPQGEVGYRCHTMDDFLWAGRNIDKIDPKRCREYAVANFSMDRIAKAYQEYFMKVQDLYEGGWYREHPERTNLDWLKRW